MILVVLAWVASKQRAFDRTKGRKEVIAITPIFRVNAVLAPDGHCKFFVGPFLDVSSVRSSAIVQMPGEPATEALPCDVGHYLDPLVWRAAALTSCLGYTAKRVSTKAAEYFHAAYVL